MTERGVGRGSQNAAATDRTTGPPAEGRYSFGGENARRADLDALDRAKEMERQGVAMETIFPGDRVVYRGGRQMAVRDR